MNLNIIGEISCLIISSYFIIRLIEQIKTKKVPLIIKGYFISYGELPCHYFFNLFCLLMLILMFGIPLIGLLTKTLNFITLLNLFLISPIFLCLTYPTIMLYTGKSIAENKGIPEIYTKKERPIRFYSIVIINYLFAIFFISLIVFINYFLHKFGIIKF